MPKRYGIFFSPSLGNPINNFARQWLGRDANSTQCTGHTGLDTISPREMSRLTSSPRHYGFHATLKPPFVLRHPHSADDLIQDIIHLAEEQTPFDLPGLKLSSIGSFLALTLSKRCTRIHGLAAQCVRQLDRFRAEPTGRELERRRSKGLTPRQEALLKRWGYPYVMDEFRFHMTLTNSIPGNQYRKSIYTHLFEQVKPFCGNPLPVEDICLFVQEDLDKPFTVAARFPLSRRRH